MTETETLNPLTEAMIDELLATPQKKRGYTKPILKEFLESREVAVNLNEKVPGIGGQNLKTSFTASIEKNFRDQMDNLAIILTGEDDNKVAVLIHRGRHNAAKAAQAVAVAAKQATPAA